MGQQSVPRGEKSTAGNANASPGSKRYQGKHRATETTPMDTKGVTTTQSRSRIGGWVKGK